MNEREREKGNKFSLDSTTRPRNHYNVPFFVAIVVAYKSDRRSTRRKRSRKRRKRRHREASTLKGRHNAFNASRSCATTFVK